MIGPSTSPECTCPDNCDGDNCVPHCRVHGCGTDDWKAFREQLAALTPRQSHEALVFLYGWTPEGVRAALRSAVEWVGESS